MKHNKEQMLGNIRQASITPNPMLAEELSYLCFKS